MRRIVAIRMDDVPDGLLVTALVARTKNRVKVWAFEHPNHNREEVLARVLEQEEKREKGEGDQLPLLRVKEALDDR